MVVTLTIFNIIMEQVGNMEGEVSDDIENIETLPDGEFCCAGILCGKSQEKTTFIAKEFIKHRCINCTKAMHGGLCGSEASVFL
jgi:hypothetical protein